MRKADNESAISPKSKLRSFCGVSKALFEGKLEFSPKVRLEPEVIFADAGDDMNDRSSENGSTERA